MTRCSHTGIIMFIQNEPIVWFSKRKNTFKADTIGSELFALRICKYLIVVLKYKLRGFGVILEGRKYIFCDNHGVVKNISIPESVLHQKTM